MKVEEEVTLTPTLGKVSLNQVPINYLVGKTCDSLSPEERVELCHLFFLNGNLSAIAREKGIHYVDLRAMSEEDWWQEEIGRLRRETTAIARAKITKLLGMTINQLEERLVEGDPHVAFGQVTFAPVGARDLAAIATTLFLKEKEMAQEGEKEGRERDRLVLIAEALRGKVGALEIINVEGESDASES